MIKSICKAKYGCCHFTKYKFTTKYSNKQTEPVITFIPGGSAACGSETRSEHRCVSAPSAADSASARNNARRAPGCSTYRCFVRRRPDASCTASERRPCLHGGTFPWPPD